MVEDAPISGREARPMYSFVSRSLGAGRALRVACLAVAGVVVAGPAAASGIPVASYDMHNGHGQAASGSFNYWDRAYNGTGNTTQDDALLTGGVGDLTDGFAATDFWFNVENVAGTGPYVGWRQSVRTNPVVQFNFTIPWTVEQIRVHVDESRVGGVFQPLGYLVNGNAWSFTGLQAGTIGWVTLTGAPVTGNSLSLTFVHQTFDHWIFVSEVELTGTHGDPIPEPASSALLLMGLGLLGAASRRRAAAVRAAA
jgi:hypothetical protein